MLEFFVIKIRDNAATLKLIKMARKHHGKANGIATDGLRSYNAAMEEIGNAEKQVVGRWAKDGAEAVTGSRQDPIAVQPG